MRPVPIDTLRRAFAIAACLAVAGCSAGVGSTQPTVTSAPTSVLSTAPRGSPSGAAAPLDTSTPTAPEASPASSASATTTQPAKPVPSPTERAYPSPRPTSIKPGDFVETLVGDVRVRSKPRVTDSVKYEPLLPVGTKLYVLDGPVGGSGYQWFWVAQLSSTELPSGWVAAAGRDGEPWLGPGDYDCPPVPDDFQSLVALPRGVGAACFSRVPITFRGRLLDCNCDPTPGSDWIKPNWLWAIGQGPFIVDPSAVRLYSVDGPDPYHYEGIELVRDPQGRFPAKLPVGAYLERDDWTVPQVVRITGMFDHPAAQTCRWDSHDERAEVVLPLDPAVGTCRLQFAVTRIVVP